MVDLPHTPMLLAAAFEHRFTTVEQLQRFCAPYVASRRTQHYQVQRLVAAGYLVPVPIRAALPTHAAAYITTARAHRRLAAAYAERFGRPAARLDGEQRRVGRGYGLLFIAHEVAVTWFDLALWELAGRRGDLQLVKTERRYHVRDRRLGRMLIPDAGYHMLHEREGRRWFEWLALEYDRGTMAPARVRAKLEAYDRWAASAAGEQLLSDLHRRHGDHQTRQPDFRLLIVASGRAGEGGDVRRLISLLAEAIALPREMRRRLWLTTAAAFEQCSRDLAAPIWIPVRHLGSQVGEDAPADPAARRRLVARALDGVRRRTLFPQVPPTSARS